MTENCKEKLQLKEADYGKLCMTSCWMQKTSESSFHAFLQCSGRYPRTVKRNVSTKPLSLCKDNDKQHASTGWERPPFLQHTPSPQGAHLDRCNRFNIISYLCAKVKRKHQGKLYILRNIRYASLGSEAYRVSAHLVFDRNTENITAPGAWKLLFMGTEFESKPAQSTHLSLEYVYWVCLILSIRNDACHLLLRRPYTSAIYCPALKLSGEKSPELDKHFVLGSFCLGLLMFLLHLVPTAVLPRSLSKQWLNPRLQSKISFQQPLRTQQRQLDPARLNQGFQQAPCTERDEKAAGTKPSSTSHPLGRINVFK